MSRALALTLATTLFAALTFAHAVVQPPESTTGQTQQYTLRVPNEKQVLTTTIQLAFPAELNVLAVNENAAWKLSLTRDASGKIVSATWTGALAPSADVQFTFSATNPANPATVEWKVIQTFQDGSRSEWTGPEGSRTPASRTRIIAPVK